MWLMVDMDPIVMRRSTDNVEVTEQELLDGHIESDWMFISVDKLERIVRWRDQCKLMANPPILTAQDVDAVVADIEKLLEETST